MVSVIAVAYAKHGRLHYASWPPQGGQETADESVGIGGRVVVDHATGPRVATVLWGPAAPLEPIDGLPATLRLATEQDEAAHEQARERGRRARSVARRQVREAGLPMQVIGAEWSGVDHRVTIWFTAPHRVDFRDLVRSLSAELSMRVLLHRVNERERAKIVGGVGVCGRELCCATFLDKFEPVTIALARDQNLAGDPLRIAGACGRLMCCLRYEHSAYVDYTGRPAEPSCEVADNCGPRAGHDAAHPSAAPSTRPGREGGKSSS